MGDAGSSAAGVIGDCELPDMGPLGEQCMLLDAEPFFQPLDDFFLLNSD